MTTSITGECLVKSELAEEGGGVLGREVEKVAGWQITVFLTLGGLEVGCKVEDTVTLFRWDLFCLKWAAATEKEN
jgi:hypothetical protein